MRHHHSFSHSSHHYQHLLQSQRQQRRILDESFTALRRGAPFLKCGRQGRPHYIYLRLAQVHVGPAMVWHSERRNKARYIPISAVHEILVGRKTNTFRRSMSSTLVSSSPTSLAFSVLYTDKMSRNGAAGVQRSLDLIASNAHELNLWVTGLLALVDGITPPTHVDSPVRKTHAHDDMFQIGFDDSGIGGGESTVSSVSTGNTSDTVNNTRSVRLGANSAALPALEEEEDNDEDCVSSRTYIDDIQAAHLASDSTRHPAYGVSVTDVNVDVNGGTHRPSWNMSHEPGGAASSKPLTQGSDVGTSSASKQVLGDMLVFGRHAKRSSAMPCPLEGSKGLDVRFSSIGADTGIIVCRGGEMYTWGGVPATAASASTAQFNSTISSANAMLGRGHCIESRMPAVVEVRNDICETLLGMKSKVRLVRVCIPHRLLGICASAFLLSLYMHIYDDTDGTSHFNHSRFFVLVCLPACVWIWTSFSNCTMQHQTPASLSASNKYHRGRHIARPYRRRAPCTLGAQTRRCVASSASGRVRVTPPPRRSSARGAITVTLNPHRSGHQEWCRSLTVWVEVFRCLSKWCM